MKKNYTFIAFAGLIFASCTVEQIAPEQSEPQGETVTIVANVTDTKTTHADRVFSWEADETISVGTSAGTYVDFDVDDASLGTFKHTFEGVAPSLLLAVSPAQSGATFTSATDYEVILPATYNNYIPGTTNALMVGAPDGVTPNKFNFSHTGALLKITYANVPVGTTAFVLEASENICGTVSLTGSDVSNIEIANDNAGLTGSKVQLNLKNKVTAVNSTITFCVPVPSGTYDMLEIYLKSADGKIAATDKTINKAITLNRGDVMIFPSVTLAVATVLTENFSATKASSDLYNCNSELATSGNDEGLDYSWAPTTGVSNNKVYIFKSGIRLGSSSYSGNITSDDMISSIPTDKICALYIYCAQWNTDGGKIQFTYNGETQSDDPANDPITNTSDTYSSSKFTKPNVFFFTKEAGKNEIAVSSSSKRIIIDKLEVVYGLTELLPKVATPGFSEAEGSVDYGTSLSLSCGTAGASIYYTIDGTTPDPTNPAQLYSSAITINDNITVKAIAVKDGYRNSDVASRSFTVPTVANPVITITSNTATITCATDGAIIYYTIDGSDPTTLSSVYSTSFSVASGVTVKAFAYKANYKSSGIVSKKNGETSVYVVIGDYATANSWENDTRYSSITINSNITASASTGGSNTGKYFTTDNTWRFYQNESGTLTISAVSGTIKKIKVTFTTKDSGQLKKGGSAITSNTDVAVNASSVTLSASASSGSKGKVFVSRIDVTYE